MVQTLIGDATTRHDDREIGKTGHEVYVLRLYVTEGMPVSIRAIANLKTLCEGRLKGRHQLEVVDILRHPELAEGQQIIALPTLVEQLPAPLRRFIGDLSDLEGKLLCLGEVGAENARRQDEAEDTLRAIRGGEVDAFVVPGIKGGQVLVLKGPEQRYPDFLETMNRGAVTLLADGTIAYSNRRFAEMLRSPLEKVIGAALEKFVAPDYRQRLRPLLERALAGATEDVIPFDAGDGVPVFAELALCPLKLDNATGICLIASDVTERKNSDELRSHLAAIVNSSDDAIVGKNLDGTILSWNRSAERLYGYSACEVIGRPVSILEPPDHAGETAEITARIKRGEYVDHFETERLRKDGERVAATVTISPIRDGDGRVIGASSIARDTTETRHAAAVLRASTSELKEAQRVALLGNWSIDAETWQITWSDEIYRMLGLDPALPATPFSEQERLFTPESWERLATALDEIMRAGKPFKLELEMVRADGTEGWMLASSEPVLDAGGAITAVRGIAQDITERKVAEKQIRELNADLERRVAARTADLVAANKELEAFSYSVSHDLRAPLRAMDGFCQALIEDYADKLDFEGKGYLLRVRAASQRMDKLIDGMLTLSRTSRSEMRRTTVDMSTLAQTIALELQKADPTRQAEFVIAPGLSVNADATLLGTALENLMGNAWKYTGKHPQARIEVGTLQQDGETTYFVRDDGAGYDMAYAGKLFGAFQRLHTAKEFEGTGIGLANVQRIINRHGGRIRGEAEVEKGATFFFTLPNKTEVTKC